MVSLLLIISFLLHIVLFIAVYYLHQQLQFIRHNREQEFESLFTDFLQDMKRENALLQRKLANENDHSNLNKKPSNESEATHVEANNKNMHPKHIQPLRVRKKDRLETSLESQILQLYKQGLPTDDIAKKLHRGKTEVELILKLQQQDVQNS